MFLRARLAKGPPVAVGMDMSTMQWRREVRLPEEVAWEALEGKIMCVDV